MERKNISLIYLTCLGLIVRTKTHKCIYQNGIDELSTFGVVTLGPVVTGTALAEDEVVGAEDLAKRSSTDGVHGTGLQHNSTYFQLCNAKTTEC